MKGPTLDYWSLEPASPSVQALSSAYFAPHNQLTFQGDTVTI